MLGKRFENLTFCDKFQPSVFDGQLCYTLSLSEAYSLQSKNGQKNSLNLVLDEPTKTANKEDAYVTTIHLDRIGGHADNRAGRYYMSNLKKMTGSDAFMALSNSEKRCQAESYKDCRTRHFFAALENECKCIPFNLAQFHNEVSLLTVTL